MAVYYNEIKGSHGSLTGSIISFPVEIRDNDPSSSLNKQLIPAGYMRCDGRVLSATEFPMLAIVLGVGSACKYQKDDQPLSDSQFQIPDLRSKHIRATTSSNIGVYNELEVLNDADQLVEKSGAGLDVIANIESPYQIDFTGSFYIPPQTTDLRGEPRFSLETGSYTFTQEVPADGFQPHMHRSETFRARQKDRNGNEFGGRQMNHLISDTSLNVCQWWENTNQMLCYWAYTDYNKFWNSGSGNTREEFGRVDFDTSHIESWGACYTGCERFVGQGYCLWPDEVTCPNMVAENAAHWNVRLSVSQDCNNSKIGAGPSTFKGNIEYFPTWTMECNCDVELPLTDWCLGGYNGTNHEYPAEKSKVLEVDLNGNKNLPVGYGIDTVYSTGFTGVNNVTTETGTDGNDATHRHRLDINPDDKEHTYKMVTRAATARADSGLVSKVSFSTNTSPKADKYIQPYIVTEYLIKI
mgnify:CR=1 FL=1